MPKFINISKKTKKKKNYTLLLSLGRRIEISPNRDRRICFFFTTANNRTCLTIGFVTIFVIFPKPDR